MGFLFVNIINWIDTRGVFRVRHAFRIEPMILYSFWRIQLIMKGNSEKKVR